MITLDAVRAAALSADPYTEMDQLIRAELSGGRIVRQIIKDFLPILDDALETPRLTEDGEESLRGTLDALTGDCHPDCHYKDPPNTTLPTDEEIAELPRWARVAFAARCARRVLTILDETWDSGKPTPINHVGWAVGVAEDAAATATILPRTTVEEADRGLAKCRAAKQPYASHVAIAASHAVEAAANPNAVHTRFGVLSGTVLAADDVDTWPQIRRDFDHLSRLAEWQKWGDDTPVPPEVFGPLWPEGPPKGWPPVTHVPQRAELVIEAFARERATEQMIEDDIVNLFNALNRSHIARSGVRHTLEQFRSLLPAFVLAEV